MVLAAQDAADLARRALAAPPPHQSAHGNRHLRREDEARIQENTLTDPTAPLVEQALLLPRYLAGPGDPAWATAALHHAAGWSHSHDSLVPRTQLTSPDRLAVLHLVPDPDQPWWVVRRHRTDANPAWSVKFGARTRSRPRSRQPV
ncbi:DUF317 domain-containing protein [Streptomyces sp. NBC_01439]|uniref:DUF317 domain-containing protein n=1 Tax=Streptomyces sp. NBC_01439 TaxID=2903867 RepID=UPI002E2B9585|nr:DUF317 domain-containing protein [Streptomyces sp. NBC_01439]